MSKPLKELYQHLNNVRDRLMQYNKNERNVSSPIDFAHEPIFGLWKQTVYFGQIRDTYPDNTRNRFRIFTKSMYKNGEPVETDPKHYSHIFVCRDLSKEQKQLLVSEISDQINKKDAEEYMLRGIPPDLGNDLHLRNAEYHRNYIFQVVKVNHNEFRDNFALVIGAQGSTLHIFWLLTRQQVIAYSGNLDTSPETLQELSAAALCEHELLLTNWKDSIPLASVRAGPIPVRPDPSAAGGGGYRCRYFCQCLPSGGAGRDGAYRGREDVLVQFDRQWTVRRVAGHDGRHFLDGAASDAAARWIAAQAVCEVRAGRGLAAAGAAAPRAHGAAGAIQPARPAPVEGHAGSAPALPHTLTLLR